MLKRYLLIAIALLLPAVAGQCEQLSLETVLTGKVYPLQRTVGELETGWLQVTVKGGTTPAHPMQQMFGRFLKNIDTYFTQGATVTIAGEEYMIAYARPLQAIDPKLLEHGDPELFVTEPLSADTQLILSLLNVRTCGSLVDIRPFDLQKSLAEMEQQRQAYDEAMSKAREKALKMQSISNLRQLAVTINMYLQDHDERFPEDMSDAVAMQGAFQQYQLSKTLFTQPQKGDLYLVNSNLAGLLLGRIENPVETVVFYEATPWADGTRGVGFLDGHVASVSAKEWENIKEKNNLP